MKNRIAKNLVRLAKQLISSKKRKMFFYFKPYTYQLIWVYQIEQRESLAETMNGLREWKREILSDLKMLKSEYSGFKIKKKLNTQYQGNDQFYADLYFTFDASVTDLTEVPDVLKSLGFVR